LIPNCGASVALDGGHNYHLRKKADPNSNFYFIPMNNDFSSIFQFDGEYYD